jgi:hypothetical protein
MTLPTGAAAGAARGQQIDCCDEFGTTSISVQLLLREGSWAACCDMPLISVTLRDGRRLCGVTCLGHISQWLLSSKPSTRCAPPSLLPP